ncbi:CHAD domain-containing protein [uncultured Amnibacterium sp.]|uniref:CHAD domain-containing protein n=1 Tax=uncultured Amnibacterium sp. TaxID=1631851 RepID=UPI0035C991BF
MSVSRTIEIERKYAVPDGVALPALADLAEVAAVDEQPVAHLDAVYVDTAARTLLAARIAVRRRTGGHDAGWHVKLPASGGRTELHAPIDADDPEALPAGLARALATRLRGRPLEPIALIRTERHGVVVAGDGGARVEVVDDRVTATDLAAGVLRAWREWEAELVGDPQPSADLLDVLHDALCAAGAQPSASPAKLAQALGLVGARTESPAPSTAGAVLATRIAAHAEDLHRGVQALVLDGDPDGETVHALRKTLRQVRSLLALRPVAGPAGEVLRRRLGALGRRLGEVRDPRVAAAVAEGLLDELPAHTPGLAAARSLLVEEPLAAQPAAVDDLVEHLCSAAVLEVVAALEGFAADGPRAGRAPRRLVDLGERAVRRARRRARDGIGGDLEDLHRARKAAKRARFVVEELVAADLVPASSRLARSARRDERTQDVLGEHRDLALVLDGLPAAAERLAADGGNAFALGRAAERGRQHLALLHLRAERAVRRLR